MVNWFNPPLQKKVAYRSGDTIIAVPAKSGTTWTMNIFHQLRTGGDADFQCRIAADRAEAVCDWLVAQGSISLSRLRTSYVPSAATLVCI